MKILYDPKLSMVVYVFTWFNFPNGSTFLLRCPSLLLKLCHFYRHILQMSFDSRRPEIQYIQAF